jgi:hypothetical protein
MSEGVEYNINREILVLEEIKKKFNTFFNFSNNLTNITINKNNIKKQNWAIILAIISLLISSGSFYLSIRSNNLALLDYTKVHPEGYYAVTLNKLLYDTSTNTDIYRIQFTYYGRGESKYLTLHMGLSGIDPSILKIGNCEIMEPNIIVVRDYVDGLTGWVDYKIKRGASIETKIIVLDYNSDVEVKINDNL